MLAKKTRQTYFNALGYKDQNGKKLAVDGIWGKRSKYVTLQFQKNNKLVADGIYGAKTDAKLGEVYNKKINPVVNKYMKDADWNKIKYFKKTEFKCKCGGRYCSGYPHEISKNLVFDAENIRKHFGKPVIVTSGLRCVTWNGIKGGVKNSPHLDGGAFDFYITGISGKDLIKYVKTLPNYNYAYIITGNVIHYSAKL